MGRTTARDVAALAGVDPSTVSRVLRGSSPRHRYDPETMKRVNHAAKRLGYVPSGAARALRTGRTRLVGLLVSDIGNPFFAELAARIERHARTRGYRLLVGNTDESSEQQQEHLADLIGYGVDGLLVSPSGSAGMKTAVASKVPLVTIDRRAPGINVPHVGLDDVAAGSLLGSRLREGGYQRVGVLMPSTDSDPGAQNRYNGLLKAVGKSRVSWVHKAALAVPRDELAGYCLKMLGSKKQRTDVVVGLHNVGTMAALDAIRGRGAVVPDDIGLAGIDDFAAAEHVRPAVTVVAQPLDQIASRAVDLLLQQMESPSADAAVKLLTPHLIERQSLRKL